MEYKGGDLMKCSEICPYRKLCLDFFGCHGSETDSKHPHVECANAYKIEDMLMEAEDIRREQEESEEEEYEE